MDDPKGKFLDFPALILSILNFCRQAIEEPFLLAVKETMCDRYTPRLEQLYRKTIHYILTVVSSGFKQSKKRQPLPRSCSPWVLNSTSATVPNKSSQINSAVPQPPKPRTRKRSP